MTRISKKAERRGKNPKKRKFFIHKKTGPKKNIFKEKVNALNSEFAFIPKIKGK